MSKKIEKKSKKKKEKKALSKNAKENIIITLGLVLFVIIISLVVYFVLRTNNPDAFKSEEELYEEELQKLMDEYNNYLNANNTQEEETVTNNGTFSVYVDDIYVEGKLPKMMREKFYIECYESGLINIYSKYTYALSQTKYGKPQGIILRIRIAKDDMIDEFEAEEGEYTLITKVNDYNVLYNIPNTIEYLEDDDISRSNYEKLSKYREEIIESIKASQNEEGVLNVIS